MTLSGVSEMSVHRRFADSGSPMPKSAFEWGFRVAGSDRLSMLIDLNPRSLAMELIVRAVDVGSGNTKFVTAAAGTDIRCASFPLRRLSVERRLAVVAGDSERKKTVCIPIGPLFYEVGPDVSLAADTFAPNNCTMNTPGDAGVHGAAAGRSP